MPCQAVAMGTRMIAIALDQDIGDVMGGFHYSRESYKERVDSRPALDQIVAQIDNSVFCENFSRHPARLSGVVEVGIEMQHVLDCQLSSALRLMSTPRS